MQPATTGPADLRHSVQPCTNAQQHSHGRCHATNIQRVLGDLGGLVAVGLLERGEMRAQLMVCVCEARMCILQLSQFVLSLGPLNSQARNTRRALFLQSTCLQSKVHIYEPLD